MLDGITGLQRQPYLVPISNSLC